MFSNFIFLTFLLILLIIQFSIVFYFLYTQIIEPGAIYYPTKMDVVKKMLKLANVTKKDTVLDLGSGDGRILIEAAKLGAKAIGYEINPVLVKRSRKKIEKLGLSHLATVHLKSFWHVDFDQATIITLYLFPNFMNRLQKLLDKKMTHPLLLVSNDYQFPQKKFIKKDQKIFLYKF